MYGFIDQRSGTIAQQQAAARSVLQQQQRLVRGAVDAKLPELGENEYEVPWERGVLGVIFLESEKGGVPYVSKATESCISPLVHAGDVLRYVNDVRSQDHSFSEFFKILATMKKPVLLRFERPASSTTSSDGEDSPLEQRSSSAAGLDDRAHAASTADAGLKVLRSNSVPQTESQPKSQRSAFWRTVSTKEPPAPAPAPVTASSEPRSAPPVRAQGGSAMHQAPGSSRGNGEQLSHGFVDTKQFELSPREPATDSDQYEYEVYWETGSLGLFFGEDRATSLPVVTRSTPNANSVVQRMVAVNDTLVSANHVQSRDFTFEAFFVRLQQMKKPVLLVFRRKIDRTSPAPGAARPRVASVTVDAVTSPGGHGAGWRLPTPPRLMPSVGEPANGLRTPPESPVCDRGSVRENRRDAASARSRKTELDIDTSGSPPPPRSSSTPATSGPSASARVSWEEAPESAQGVQSESLKQAKRSTSVPSPRSSAPPAILRQSSSSSSTPATHISQPQHAHSTRSRTPSSDATSWQSEPAPALDAALRSPQGTPPSSPLKGDSAFGSASAPREPSSQHSSSPRGVSEASSLSSPKLPDAAEATSSLAVEAALEAEEEMHVISPTAIEGQVRMSEEGLSMWEEDVVAANAPEHEAPVGLRSSWDEPLEIEGDAFDAEGKALDDEFELLMAKLHESATAAATGVSAALDDAAVVEMGVVTDVAVGIAVTTASQPPAGASEEAEIGLVAAAEPVASDSVIVEIVSLDTLPVALGEAASEDEEEADVDRKSALETELESDSDAGLADDGSDLLDTIEQDIIADIDGNDLMPPAPKLKSASSSGGSGGSVSPFKANRSTVHANLAKYKRRPKNSRAVAKLPRLTEDTALTVPLVAPNAVNTTVQVRGRAKPKPSMHETPDSTTYLVKWRESRSIGLQLKEVRLAKGVFPLVTDVCQESCCEQLKHVCVGDVILEINGRNTSLMGVKKTVGFLKTCSKTTLLKLRHGPGYVPQRVSAHV
ncbi:hypothetical protein PybrP1_010555 [[Pythium] brassicae (nom. inval.)]|nr:hypothetical protein PybrP1_010555 [[Pythium] brassicae (nom. inval.)]